MNKFIKQITLASVILLVSIVFSAFSIELMLRWSGFAYPSWEVRDKDLGFVGLPGAEGPWRAEGDRGYVVFNQHGFRDKERSLLKPTNTTRIAVLGDSFVQAREVTPDETFTIIAEQELNNCTVKKGQHFEILNFGVGAYNTAAELQLLRKRVWEFAPDVVVLAFFVGNDIQGNHPEMDYYKDISGIGIPLFSTEGGGLQIVRPYLNDPVFNKRLESSLWPIMLTLINKSAFLQFMNYSRHNFRKLLDNFISGWKVDSNSTPSFSPPAKVAGHWIADGTNDAMFSPKNTLWKEAWELTEAGISTMASEVNEHQSDFWLMLIPHPPQVHWKDNDAPPLYPQKRLALLAERIDVSLIDLYPDFRERFLRDNEYLFGLVPEQNGDGHWNPGGHRLAASVLSQRLCKALGGLIRGN